MGTLYYGTTGYAVDIDDRPLAHLKIAILTLLRAQRSIAFSFDRPASAGSGRETLWISPSTDLRFRFNGSRPPTINQIWVRRIIDSADAPTGLMLVPESAAEGDAQ